MTKKDYILIANCIVNVKNRIEANNHDQDAKDEMILEKQIKQVQTWVDEVAKEYN